MDSRLRGNDSVEKAKTALNRDYFASPKMI
jgi:hypothetical protein